MRRVLTAKLVNRLEGIPASEFTAERKASFKKAVDGVLTVNAKVVLDSIVATDALRRRVRGLLTHPRVTHRILLNSGAIDVTYTIELEVGNLTLLYCPYPLSRFHPTPSHE